MAFKLLLLTSLFVICSCQTLPTEKSARMTEALFLDPNVGRSFSTNPHPLSGLRIALDPGHIGEAPWDERTGKYIVDSKGRRLSEGIMVLQIALLLENDLRALGADVLITHRDFHPVTDADYATYEKANRSETFFKKADLEARADKILKFAPDITVILHLDESTPGEDHNVEHLKKRCNDTKAYVSGAFADSEVKSDSDIILVRRILATPQAWQNSVRLSRSIVSHVSQRTSSPLMDHPSGAGAANMIMIEPGVFARNLYLQRHLAGLVSSYAELLCYEDPAQMDALSAYDHTMKIGDKDYPYSNRLTAIADGVRDGIIEFFKSDR